MPNTRNPQMVEALNQWLANHVDEIAQRRRGMSDRLRAEFETATGHHIQASTFIELVRRYRRDNGVEFVQLSRYYTPKRAQLAASLQDTSGTA
jgi:recombinational DNA repair ATPase RecF